MILILNGPNLNLLGTRRSDLYGRETLASIVRMLKERFADTQFESFQSNSEGALIDRIHAAHYAGAQGVIFNPGAYTHTSVALRDAIEAITPPVVEVHLSNIYARESFRHHSLLAPVCVGQITGLGPEGYVLAASYLTRIPLHVTGEPDA